MKLLTGWAVVAMLIACGMAAEAKTVTLGSPDNRTAVSLNLGDTLVAELPAGDVPDFRWVPHLPAQTALSALNDSTEAAANGRPAMRLFRFNAATEGDVVLVFGFESATKTPGVAADTSSYSVQVHVGSGAPTGGTAVLFGVYKGTMPCADCSGLETTLRLYAKSQYDTTYAFFVRTQTYRGAPHGDLTYSDRGEWGVERGDATDPNATVYRLYPDNPQKAESLLVEQSGAALLQLDREGRRIDTKMNLTLKRVQSQ